MMICGALLMMTSMAIHLDSPPAFAVVAMCFFRTIAGARNAPSIFGALKRTYYGGENDYMTGFFILTFNFGKNNQDPAKDPRIQGKWP